MRFATADLSDAHPEAVVVAPVLRHFGGVRSFHGPVRTVRCLDDNSKVKALLETQGQGAVLVVDGGASTRCALLGGNLATLAHRNGWAGVIVHGCVRDTLELADANVGVMALASVPRKSEKRNVGEVDVEITFGGVAFRPGAFVYADEDGVLVAAAPLTA